MNVLQHRVVRQLRRWQQRWLRDRRCVLGALSPHGRLLVPSSLRDRAGDRRRRGSSRLASRVRIFYRLI